MTDREKVIRLIEEEISVCESVNQCYRTIDLPALRDILAVLKEQEQMYYTLEHDWRMCRELLKEQQAEIERMKGEGKSPTWKKGKAFCGNCGGCLENKDRLSTYYVQSIRFCKWCGAPVDWSNE